MSLPHDINSERNKLFVARLVSRVAEPIIWIPVMIWLVLLHINLPDQQKILYYPLLLLFVFIIPFSYFMYLVFIKKEFDIDVTERRKRVGFTLKSMVSFGIAVALTFVMDRELFVITLAVFLSTLSLVLITIYWKISFHGGLNTLIVCTVNYIYNWELLWMFMLLIPIGWSRLVMKKHNLTQFLAGIFLCAIIFLSVTATAN